jgi:hypothetical protein
MDDSLFGGAVPGLGALRVQRKSLGSFDFGNTKKGLWPLKGNVALAGTALDDAIFGTILLPDSTSPRAVDILPIFYTGVPNLAPYQLATGKGGNPLAAGKPFINNFLPTLGDMLRLNMAVPVTARTDPKFSSLGIINACVLGLTDPAYNTNANMQFIPNMDGFPNGRRLEDDVTTIELQAVSGVALAAIGLWYDDYTSGSPLTPNLLSVLGFNAGVTHNDTIFKTCFPYLQAPWRGFVGDEYKFGVKVCAKAFLNGCYDANTGMMYDSLRALNLIPTVTPYGNGIYTTGFAPMGKETTTATVLATTGANAIVDWVYLELRSKTNSSNILYRRSALLQRDGDIVEVDGVSPVSFTNTPTDQYFVSVKHRNHLGVMTAMPQALTIAGANCINFGAPSTNLFTRMAPNNNPAPLTGATKPVGNVRTMYSGNCNISTNQNAFRYVYYSNFINSDRTSLFGVTNLAGSVMGYTIFDVNMNGVARFNGTNPDRLLILQTAAGSNTIFTNEQLP